MARLPTRRGFILPLMAGTDAATQRARVPAPTIEVARLLGFAAIAWLAADIGLLTYSPGAGFSLIWPLPGIALLWLASCRRALLWLDTAVLAAVVGVVVHLELGDVGLTLISMVQTAAGALVTVAVLRRFAPHLWGGGGRAELSRMGDVGVFLAACVAGAVVSVLVRGSGLGLAPLLSSLDLLTILVRNLAWTLVIGSVGVLLGPHLSIATLTTLRARRPLLAKVRWWRVLEAGGVAGATAGSLTLAYLVETPVPINFTLMLSAVWAGTRFPPLLAMIQPVSAGVVAVLVTLGESGILADTTKPVTAALLSQALLAALVLVTLALAVSTTERKAATRRAEESEVAAAGRADLLDAVMTNMREGLVVVQSDGSVLYRNPAGRRLIGLDGTPPDPHILSAQAYGFFAPDGAPVADDQMAAALAFAGQEVFEKDYLLRTHRFPEGRILEMTANQIPAPAGAEQQQVVVNFRDVTDVRRDRDDLASFAGVVAHDLLNPLSIVDGWTEALLESFEEGPVTSEVGASMAIRVQAAAQHMRHFIGDLLSYTVARDHQLRLDDIDLSALTEHVAALRRQADSRPLIEVSPGMEVRGDAALMRQLLDNLIGNAVKYVAPGVRPHIMISARPAEELVEVIVDDNGIGVAEDMRQRIFENFQRAATGYTGTGIGLAICHRIVERHGGSIHVETNPTGHGSRFVCLLPSVTSRTEAAPESVA